jgi:hypothetical protein
VAAGCVDHDPAPGQGPGPEGYRTFFSATREAFPDLDVGLETMVADEESVAIAYTMHGTHRGPLMGIPPTGKKISIRGVQVAKFRDGKMVDAGEAPASSGCCSSWALRSCRPGKSAHLEWGARSRPCRMEDEIHPPSLASLHEEWSSAMG